ncbi:MAG: tetratricopeptide repeat protein [Chitinispirillaceae bacterium]|jgi:tetratricopeptide (TPR) repeat protein
MVKPTLPFSWNRDLVLGLLLVSATFLAYRPVWNGKPVWDDDINLSKPEFGSVAGLASIWTQPSAMPQYYPLVYTVFWMEYHLWGASTLGYHLLSILLHVFSALLLVRILRRLGIPGEAAWLAGGIFALHPVMVESVAWMTELKNTLSGVFFLAAALMYLKFDNKRGMKHYIISLLLFLFGLLAKSAIVTLPGALLAVFWWMRGRIGWKRDSMPLLPFFAIGIISGLFTAWVERRFVGAEGTDFNLAFIDRCLIAGRAFWFYFYKLLWPDNLILIYPRWHIDAAAVWQYLFPATVLLIAVLFWAMRERSRTPLAVLLYFAVTLFPALGFLNVNFFRFSFVADHFLYLASIGPIAAGGAVIVQGTGLLKERLRRPVQPLFCSLLLSVLFLQSWKQSGIYTNAETLYRTTVTRNDNCWLAHNNLGHLLADKGRTDEAMAQLLKAVEINPNYGDAQYNLGVLFTDRGRTDEAKAHYLKAVELNPNNAYAHINLGTLFADKGRTDEAMAHYLKAVELAPNDADAHNNLGAMLAKMGRTDEAIAHYQKALEINPEEIGALTNLAFALWQKGQLTDAGSVLQKALASAKSAGDEARAKTIAQFLTKLDTVINSSQVNSKTHK